MTWDSRQTDKQRYVEDRKHEEATERVQEFDPSDDTCSPVIVQWFSSLTHQMTPAVL
jgi:hypothetical protein